MRKFKNPLPAGGAPLYNTELNGVLQKEFWDVIEQTLTAILYGSSSNVIVSGGILTDNADGTLDITEGLVYINNGVDSVNQFMRFEAGSSITFPCYLTTNTEVVEQIEFADAVDKDYISEYTAQVVTSVPATPYITLDFPTDTQIYLKNILSKQEILNLLIDDLNAQRRARPEMVATVDSAGNMTVTMALEGTWTCVKGVTGFYNIRQDGTSITNSHVQITPLEVSTANGRAASWKSSNGNVKIYDVPTANLIDCGFAIVPMRFCNNPSKSSNETGYVDSCLYGISINSISTLPVTAPPDKVTKALAGKVIAVPLLP